MVKNCFGDLGQLEFDLLLMQILLYDCAFFFLLIYRYYLEDLMYLAGELS